jgi:SagB-type dehydrogenase family enzyme
MPDEDQSAQAGNLAGAVYANSYGAVHPWVGATGLRTHGLRRRSLGEARFPRVAEDFLANTRYSRYDRETDLSIRDYFLDPGVTMLSLLGHDDRAGLEQRPLPRGPRLRREFGEVLGGRRSRRLYTGDPVPLDSLGTILRAGGAVTTEATAELMSGGEARLYLRTAPSGGGLYPVELLVVALRVSGLEKGIYRHVPISDSLALVGNRRSAEDAVGCLAVPEEIVSVSRMAAVLLLTGWPWRSMRKYGPRGLRFLFIEAGAIAQNVNLATEALGLGSVDCASFYDDELHEVLGIDGLECTVLHAVLIGQPS